MTNDILAYPARRMRFLPSEEERRRILVRDGIAWVLVGLIHLLMFLGLVISLEQARVRPGSRSGVETIFDLSMMRARPLPLNIAPPEPNEQRDISAKPLTVIPPKPPVVQVEPPASPQATPGDVLNSVGQYLACSAGIFEYLNRQQQARCLHQPWQGLELPNGTIVLLPPSLQAAPGPLQMTGAEALQRRSQTAPDCPIMVNTPCLADMFNGGGQLAPGIPDPHQ